MAESERLTRAHQEKRQEFVSAPVFGRPDAAASAKLFIVLAGRREAVVTCQPLFDVLGQRTFPIGDKPPMANLVKLSGNFLIASVIESLGEAVALVSKGGIDRVQYIDILTNTLFGGRSTRPMASLSPRSAIHLRASRPSSAIKMSVLPWRSPGT
jgi:3-hydroxyisobutyrate dehydrogenase-like beta-hydroxyacid dehydrogenase